MTWDDCILAHARRYPRWQVVDVYKLIYQGVFGAEHALRDAQLARRYLEDEWARLVPAAVDEPLFEPLRADGALGRVNLRPYKAQGGDVEALYAAWMVTAGRVHGTVDALRDAWEHVEALAQQGALPFALAELRQFWQDQAAQGFPAVHHSALYRSLYAPAYRVVLLEGLTNPPQKVIIPPCANL